MLAITRWWQQRFGPRARKDPIAMLLSQDRQRFWAWVACNSALAWVAGVALQLISEGMARWAGAPVRPGHFDDLGPPALVLLATSAPLLETLALAALAWIALRVLKGRDFPSAICIAILFGALHYSHDAPSRALSGAATFFIFACAFLSWKRISWWRGYWAAALPHLVVNLAGTAAILAGRL